MRVAGDGGGEDEVHRAANLERGTPGFEPAGRFDGRSDSRSDTCLLPEPLLRCGKSPGGTLLHYRCI